MTQIRTSILISLIILCFSNIKAQNQDVVKDLSNGNLQEQFDYIISNSNRYQEYKVVKRTWLEELKSHVADSLDAFRKDIKETSSIITDQKEEISSLKEQLKTTDNSLSKVNSEKDRISFFGISMQKTFYKSIMWAIIGALAILLFIFIGRFATSKRATIQAKKSLAEVQEEFDTYKNKAMEDEQKLRRKLQDEINKHL